MKKARKEIDVDFIGGEGALTKEEEQLITEFIKSRKHSTGRRSAQQPRLRRVRSTTDEAAVVRNR
jgi:hypothetical protein